MDTLHRDLILELYSTCDHSSRLMLVLTSKVFSELSVDKNNVMTSCVSNGSVTVANFFTSVLHYRLSTRLFYQALRETCPDFLDWMMSVLRARHGGENTQLITGMEASCSAAYAGNIENLNWLLEKGCTFSTHTFSSAAKGSNEKTLEWLEDKSCPFSSLAYDHAINGHNLATFKWMKQRGYEWSFATCTRYQEEKHTHSLSTCVEKGHIIEREACTYAAREEDLESLKLFRQKGYPWCKDVTVCATLSGNLELLKWCIEEGCPWDESTCLKLSEGEVKEWIESM